VLPGGRVSRLILPGVFEALTRPALSLVPILHRLDGFLVGIVRQRLQALGRQDIGPRLAVLDQALYRFETLGVALENGRSVLKFMGETERLEVLRELHEADRLVGLFPAGVDLILDAALNRRIIRGLLGAKAARWLWIVPQTHFVTLEEPAWATRVLRPLFDPPCQKAPEC